MDGHINQTVVVVLFRLYLFCAIVSVIWYVFRRYGMRFIVQSIDKKEQAHQELVSRIAVLTAQLAEKERLVEKETLESGVLKKKIDTWDIERREEALRKQSMQETYVVAMQERIKNQKAYYAHKQHRAMIVPLVFDQLEKDLTRQMGGESGALWLSDIVNTVKRNHS